MASHAFLSASSSHRWLNCPPSAKLCEQFPDETSTYALEGTEAHELCAYLVESALGKTSTETPDPRTKFTYYSNEMEGDEKTKKKKK